MRYSVFDYNYTVPNLPKDVSPKHNFSSEQPHNLSEIQCNSFRSALNVALISQMMVDPQNQANSPIQVFGSFPLLEKINVKGFNESVFRRETKSNYCYSIRGVCATPTKTLKGFFLESKFCFCSELCLCHCRKYYFLMQGLLC